MTDLATLALTLVLPRLAASLAAQFLPRIALLVVLAVALLLIVILLPALPRTVLLEVSLAVPPLLVVLLMLVFLAIAARRRRARPLTPAQFLTALLMLLVTVLLHLALTQNGPALVLVLSPFPL